MNQSEILKLLLKFYKEKRPNHFFAYQFYNWCRKQAIEITLEFKRIFRNIIKNSGRFKTQKTSYKSTKVYILLVQHTLTIRKYTKKVFQVIKTTAIQFSNSLRDLATQITQRNTLLRTNKL